jgi:hypothetical protein
MRKYNYNKTGIMGLAELLKDERFNVFFSFILGVGIVCILRPVCSGAECSVTKAPEDKDFDKYAYRMGKGKCYEFKSEVVDCPVSGAVEAFRECGLALGTDGDNFRDDFARRNSPIKRCE